MKLPYSMKDLYNIGSQPSYSGRNLDEIAFPLGGIGTGSISLGGWGQLRDWEIMNRPAKGFVVPKAFFTLKIRFADRPPITKVLQGPVGGSYSGDGHSLVPSYSQNDLGQGLPHFNKVVFTGEFPIATIKMDDPDIPLHVILKAFNPFIPLNDKDSSIPVAIFSYTFKNIHDEEVKATVYGNLTNIIGDPEKKDRINKAKKESGLTGLYLSTRKFNTESPHYGSMALATTWPDTVVWPRWKDSSIAKFWETVAFSDEFPPKRKGESDTGTIAVNFVVKPHDSVTITFFIAWFFPTYERYWGRRKEGEKAITWQNFYATLWKDAWDVALYTASNLAQLSEETILFHDTLFHSTLPIHVLDAVSSQLSILKTNTCLRLENGTFYGFEGTSNTAGCCEGSCTHVWNYAQALPYIFPNLQLSMLNAHLANCVRDDGFMTFRMPLPIGTMAESTFHPAADGQMGVVLQIYREWLISGDNEWLKSIWSTAKKLLEFAWKYWDANKDGIMEGMQHNTYDIEFYGPNTLTGSLYLAALRSMENVAEHLGEYDKAQEYREIFMRGSKWTGINLFNGEYYEQKVNPTAHEVWPEPYRALTLQHGKDDKFNDWPKWQFGKGCLADQLIGQWYAQMLGLGNLYDSADVKKALRAIFRYNWKPSLRDHACLLRIYAVNDEAGLVICTWPKGDRPGFAMFYVDEVWCGIEYQVASHMIYEGMIKEGLTIALGTRRRYRGDRRNPWDEFECGHHYARSMASYSLLLALSGFFYSAPEKRLGFAPKIHQSDFKAFFSTAMGWGHYSQKIDEGKANITIDLKYGSLCLNQLDLTIKNVKKPKVDVTINGKKVKAEIKREKDKLSVLMDSVIIKRGQVLKVFFHKNQ